MIEFDAVVTGVKVNGQQIIEKSYSFFVETCDTAKKMLEDDMEWACIAKQKLEEKYGDIKITHLSPGHYYYEQTHLH